MGVEIPPPSPPSNSSPPSPTSPPSFPPRKRLPDQIWRAGWISFFTDVASEMVYPVIPLFLVGVLKAPASALGLIEGAAQALINVMRALSGWHSDRSGKRTPYIRFGYGISALSRPLLALATAWPFVLVARLLDRFGKGVRTTARDALIADAAPAGQEGRAFGLHRAMDSAGAVLGSSIGWLLLLVLPGNYRLIFLLTIVPSAAAVWISFQLKEVRRDGGDGGDGGEVNARWKVVPSLDVKGGAPSPPSPPSRTSLPARFWWATGIMCLFGLANSSDTFLLLRAQDLGNTAAQVALMYVLYNVTYSALSYPLGSLSDRIGKLPLIFAGWLLYALTYWGFSIQITVLPWLLLPMYGIYMALTDGVSKALVANVSPADKRGTAMGIFYFATGTTALAASVFAGWLWDSVNHRAPFVFGAAVAGASGFLALIVLPLATKHRKVA